MTEVSIASAIAAPYLYKLDSDDWTLRSECYARIELLGDQSRHHYRIVILAQNDSKCEVLCNLPLFKEIIYHKSSGLFHQFADKNTLYGLRFTGEEEAARFAASFENVINILNNPPSSPTPVPSVSISMPASTAIPSNTSPSNVEVIFSSSPTPQHRPTLSRRDSSSGGNADPTGSFHAGALSEASRAQNVTRKPLLGANRELLDTGDSNTQSPQPDASPPTPAVAKTMVRSTSGTGQGILAASNTIPKAATPAVTKIQVTSPKNGPSPRAAAPLVKAASAAPDPKGQSRSAVGVEEASPSSPISNSYLEQAANATSSRPSPLSAEATSPPSSSLLADHAARTLPQTVGGALPSSGSSVSPRGVTPVSPKANPTSPAKTPSKPPPLLVPKAAPAVATPSTAAPVITPVPIATPSMAASHYMTIRSAGASPSVPNLATIRRPGVGLSAEAIIPISLTPGTSAAMEKLETAEEQTRHPLKIDFADPRWKPAALFVQLMIECAEQLFPNKGRFAISTLPKLIKRSIEYLEQEAVAVENVFLYEYLEKLERLDRLKAYIEKDQDLTKSSREQTVHLIAELVKRHCRDVPGQLINLDAYDPSYSFGDMPDDATRLQYIQELVNTLPPSSKIVLECVITLLHRVHLASNVTKMDAARLGAVFGPLLLRPQLLEYKRPQPAPLRVALSL